MRKWFETAQTIEELRKEYRRLLKIYHPDSPNGDEEIAKEIMNEYDLVFSILKEKYEAEDSFYTNEENERFKTIINEIVGYNITVEVIGSWVWCFNAFTVKDKLKALGFTWCSRKKAWVWHDQPFNKRYRKEIPLSQIRRKYGSEIIKNQSYQYKLN